MKKIILALFLLALLFAASCIKDSEAEKRKEYEKCTSVCSSVLSDDFVTLELCRQECGIKFLEES